MSLKDYQKVVDEWAQQFKKPYWDIKDQFIKLVEEVGELSTEINNRWGDRPSKPTEEKKEIADEIADCLFTLICMANNLGIDIDEAFERIMHKYKIRDKDRHEKKD